MAFMSKNHSLDLTEGSIPKRLMQFFFPLLFGMLFQQFYNTVDAIVIGNYEGDYALGAVGGSTATIINLIIGVVTGLSSGSSVVLSQLFGAKDRERMSRTVHTVLCFYFLVGVALTLFGWFITPAALRLVNTPAEIMPLSTIYMRVYFLGSIPLLIYNIAAGILRAVGDSEHPLYFLIISCVLNIALNMLFVAWLRMGVAGVALGTVIAELVSALLAMRVIMRSGESYAFRFSKMEIHWPSLWRTLRIGIPSGIQSSMFSVSNMIIQTAVNGLGPLVVAGWTTQSKLCGVFWMATNAFNLSISAFAGQCFGAGKYDRLKKSVRVGLLLNGGIGFLISGALLLCGRPAARLFTQDPAVVEVCYRVILILAPAHLTYAVIDVLAGTLRGVGETFRPTMIIVIGICLVRILWVSFVVPRWPGLDGIAMSYPVSWLLTMGAMIVLYYKTKWLEHARRLGGVKGENAN